MKIKSFNTKNYFSNPKFWLVIGGIFITVLNFNNLYFWQATGPIFMILFLATLENKGNF